MQPYFTSNGLVTKALEHAFKLEHIMDLTRLRCLGSLFSMLHQACRNVAQYNANHPDFPMQIDQLERYIQVILVCRPTHSPKDQSWGNKITRLFKSLLLDSICFLNTILFPHINTDDLLSFQRYLVYAILWSFSGDSRLKMRAELGEYIRRITTVPLPSAPNIPIIDYEVKTVVFL